LTFEALLEPFCLMLADKLATRLERGQARLISQTQSELGPRQHRAAVRRRIDKGEGGAFRRGRKHLLTLEAYYEELARTEEPLSSPPVRQAPQQGEQRHGGRAGGRAAQECRRFPARVTHGAAPRARRWPMKGDLTPIAGGFSRVVSAGSEKSGKRIQFHLRIMAGTDKALARKRLTAILGMRDSLVAAGRGPDARYLMTQAGAAAADEELFNVAIATAGLVCEIQPARHDGYRTWGELANAWARPFDAGPSALPSHAMVAAAPSVEPVAAAAAAESRPAGCRDGGESLARPAARPDRESSMIYAVAPAGLEPASPFGRGILSPLRLPFRQGALAPPVRCGLAVRKARRLPFPVATLGLRRGPDSNRRMTVLQTAA
jgi:hypothetical protein